MSLDPQLGPPRPVAWSHDAQEMLRLRPLARSVGDGRSWVKDRVRAAGAGSDTIDIAALLTSELVTNAVKYGPAAGTIVLQAAWYDGTIDVAVSDANHDTPAVLHPGPDDLGGRGLLLVDALSSAWGVELHAGDGKSLWFRLLLGSRAA